MDSEFERKWRQARTYENAGRIADAKALYESLLAEDPERLYVRLRLSAIEQGQGHYRAAREHALKCANPVRTKRWSDLAAVTRRLLTFDEVDLVAELIIGADWSHPDVIRHSAVLSQHLWLTGRVDEALDLVTQTEPLVLPSAALSYSKATALRYRGKMDEASAEYERCINLAPHFAHAHWSLASHRRGSQDEPRIPRIEQALQSLPEDEERERPYLHYALFKEWDFAGDVDKAWSHLMEGARGKRRQLHFDDAAEEAGFRLLQEKVGRDFICSRSSSRTVERVPIFILGMPRTGTTLVERIIGAHSQVQEGGELNDFRSALCLATDRFIGNWVSTETVIAVTEADFGEIGELYLMRTRSRAKGRHFLTDKNPANFAYAGFIAAALPTARILCLRREPMDACFSNLKELFGNDAYGYSYDLQELASHYLRFDRLCSHWRQVMPHNFMEVSYEDLVRDPESMTRKMFAFCGLPYEPHCIDITRNRAPVSTASSSQVRQPINDRGIGAWRRYGPQLEPLAKMLGLGSAT